MTDHLDEEVLQRQRTDLDRRALLRRCVEDAAGHKPADCALPDDVQAARRRLHVPLQAADAEGLGLYGLQRVEEADAALVYMATLGNRPDLFPGYTPSTDAGTDYEIPPEALEDEQFAAMMAEAEKYIGFPYVWGGSSPATSFDCSGFVSWVVNNCGVGWNVGRLTAQGLYNICTPVSEAEAKPGDLVFFEYTYEGPWITHVGIYVGEGYMIHAGSPIGYLKFMDSYYSDNFVGFGRLPAA